MANDGILHFRKTPCLAPVRDGDAPLGRLSILCKIYCRLDIDCVLFAAERKTFPKELQPPAGSLDGTGRRRMVGQPADFRRVSVFPELHGPQPNAATIWRPISETDALAAQLVLYRQTVETALFGVEFNPDSFTVENLRGGGKFHVFPHFLQYELGDQAVSARRKMHIVRAEVARLVVQMFSRRVHVEERQFIFRGDLSERLAVRHDFVRIAKASYPCCSCLAPLLATLENSFVVHRHRGQQDDFALGIRFLERREQLLVLCLLDIGSDPGRGEIVFFKIARGIIVP